MHFENDILGQLRNRRRVILEIILLALFLGVLLNLFSSAFYEVINDTADRSLKYPFRYWGIIFFSVICFVLFIFMREKGARSLNFRVVFPVVAQGGHPHLAEIPGYAPTRLADGILQQCMVFHPEEKERMLSQLGLQGSTRGPGNKYFFQSVSEVIIVLLVKMLKLHGEHTQTPLGKYHLDYADIHNKLETASLELNSEEMIGHGLPGLPRRIKLPKGITLSFGTGTTPTDKIVLQSTYATLEIVIQPYWTVIAPEKAIKTYKIATRSLQQHEKIALLAIPVSVAVKVHIWALLKLRKTDNYCNWLDFLLTETRRWFSWEYFQEGDHERLLVELYEMVTQKTRQTETGEAENDNK
ncbi:MAG: hypothetical protein BM485_13660 [Desulfobulbaceae bacterium DB1]|nr:MAG: hypothetical protein BM485_13660 [Desulfobulbaceae bacterium DB1]